ncbi:MAG: immune inhibitor A [Actinomycetota bacterium]|nr:immune inhibitor A [Actinomycetota bacterium]
MKQVATRKKRLATVSLILGLLAMMLPSIGAGAAPAGNSPPGKDTRHVGPDYNKGKPLPFREGAHGVASRAPGRTAARAGAPPVVGDDRAWLALDDAQDAIYLKNYRLRGVGDKIEVWVAHDRDEVSKNINFQPDDCRNGERTRITDAQVNYLIDEFDSNMFPVESQAFSIPPDRDGTNAILPGEVDLPANYYQGPGDRIVVLIDNVRDDNFYDMDNENNFTYIAGFFYSLFNELVDRNVMTIDAFDWLHRTGANPPNDPDPGDPCANAPGRAFLYEGVFAHEYQHLLEYYEDADETAWLNEGLSDYAQTITDYVDPSLPITDQEFDSHVQCFLGFLGRETAANPIPGGGGPENSLTAWEDQGDDEILCDYGAAYTMMEYLADKYGPGFMRNLHRDDANGLKSLGKLLANRSAGVSAADTVHRWAAMVALDEVLGGGATLNGGDTADYQTDTLAARINFSTKHAYSKDGAPPNGSDYVRLRDDAGHFLAADAISQVKFNGTSSLPSLPIEWKVDRKPPHHEDNPALHSGSGPNFDRAIVKRVRVPKGNPELSFRTKWKTEEGWDFGFVQVSTDNGKTYKSLGNKDTTDTADPGAISVIKQNLPGFTGNSKGWRTERFNLAKYAGSRVLLSFRYVTDPSVDLPGWWIDEVKVGRNSISQGKSLAEWRSMSEVRRKPISGFTVQLVAYTDAGDEAWIADIPLGPRFDGSLSGAELTGAIGDTAETVAAIVTYDEPTEAISPVQYAPYRLKVNGVLQPGG